ncbi:MAG TPA: SMI1/KNR4 family protein [Planctomycetota bacterium]|nr:SMI1/KNR4 family protein [Planctomycetota bacterium]
MKKANGGKTSNASAKVAKKCAAPVAKKAIRRAKLQLHPVLSAEKLASWEDAAEIRLPDEYRSFLLELGNGGAGPPPTGVWPLDEPYDFLYGWTRSPPVLEALRRPFPLKKAWIWGEKEFARSRAADREWIITTRQLRDGLLYLGSQAKKTIYWVLVVTGPARGQVWFQAPFLETAEPGEDRCGRYQPVAPDFLSWYADWLSSGKVNKTIPPPLWKPAAEPRRKKKRRAKLKKIGLDTYLTRLRKVYRAEGVKLELNRGATRAQVAKYEKSLGFEVSSTLRELWQTANGTKTPMFARPDVLSGYNLMSVNESRSERRAFAERAASYDGYEQDEPRDKRIQPNWYDRGWVPFAEFGGGSLVLIEDHAPTRKGKPGQIIGYVHDPDEIVYVADSLSTLMPESIQAIEDDPYEVGISSDSLG